MAVTVSDGRFGQRRITTAEDTPLCATQSTLRPSFNDGAPWRWAPPSGAARHACVFRPQGAGRGSERPLVVWLHANFSSATALYDETALRVKAPRSDLSGDPRRPGFVLAALQARNLHWPNPSGDGARFDHYHRELSENPDVQALDHLIDALVAEGSVDPRRVYVVGWSGGALFAEFYALQRHQTPTAGGTRVAAAAAYAFGDPFESPVPTGRQGCAMSPYPRSDLPLYLLERVCDAGTPCDAMQRVSFRAAAGLEASRWSTRLQTDVGDPNVSLQLIDERGAPALRCASTCAAQTGWRNHTRWPDGISDAGAHDWEPTVLEYLRDHPLR